MKYIDFFIIYEILFFSYAPHAFWVHSNLCLSQGIFLRFLLKVLWFYILYLGLWPTPNYVCVKCETEVQVCFSPCRHHWFSTACWKEYSSPQNQIWALVKSQLTHLCQTIFGLYILFLWVYLSILISATTQLAYYIFTVVLEIK